MQEEVAGCPLSWVPLPSLRPQPALNSKLTSSSSTRPVHCPKFLLQGDSLRYVHVQESVCMFKKVLAMLRCMLASSNSIQQNTSFPVSLSTPTGEKLIVNCNVHTTPAKLAQMIVAKIPVCSHSQTQRSPHNCCANRN